MKFSIKDSSSKCDQIRSSCGFGHIYRRISEQNGQTNSMNSSAVANELFEFV